MQLQCITVFILNKYIFIQVNKLYILYIKIMAAGDEMHQKSIL